MYKTNTRESSHLVRSHFIRLYLVLLPPYCKAQEGYFPFKTYEDLDGPVLDYRDSQPVYLTEFELNKFVNEQEKEDSSDEKVVVEERRELIDDYDDYQFNDEIIETSDNPLPPETYLPKPTTKSPNYQDPFYIRTKNTRIGNKGSIGGISSEYIYHKEKSGRKDSRISPDDFKYRQVMIRSSFRKIIFQ